MEDSTLWRQKSSAGLPYRTLKGASGSVSYNSGTVTEKYLIVASDLLAWLEAGFPTITSVFGILYYPEQPAIPGLGTLVPLNISFDSFDNSLPVDPFGADPDAPDGTYGEYMVLTVQYGTHPANGSQPKAGEDGNPLTFLNISSNASGVFLTTPLDKGALWELIPGVSVPYDKGMDSGTLKIKETGEPSSVDNQNIPHGIVEPQVEWTVTWPSIPFTYFRDILMPKLRARLGRVNSTPMAVLFYAPAETILFMSYSASTSFTWKSGFIGEPPMTLSMKFIEKNFITKAGPAVAGGAIVDLQVTHNHLYRPNFGYRKLKVNDKYMYATADLNVIWSL